MPQKASFKDLFHLFIDLPLNVKRKREIMFVNENRRKSKVDEMVIEITFRIMLSYHSITLQQISVMINEMNLFIWS